MGRVGCPESGRTIRHVFWGTAFWVVGSNGSFLTPGIVSCRSNSAQCSIMLAKKDVASSNAAGKGKKVVRASVSFGRSGLKKPTELLNKREFCERFYIQNGISVHLLDGDPTSTEKVAQEGIFFSKEQFNAGLRFPLSSLLKQLLHFTQIMSAFIHPNII